MWLFMAQRLRVHEWCRGKGFNWQESTRPITAMCKAASGQPAQHARSAMARAVLLTRPMKDLLFVAATGAFFALAWIYTKSFDRL
jgi:hypothetical protein